MGRLGLSVLLGTGIAVALLVAGGIASLRSIDFNACRAVIVDRIEKITGREVTIAGDLGVLHPGPGGDEREALGRGAVG